VYCGDDPINAADPYGLSWDGAKYFANVGYGQAICGTLTSPYTIGSYYWENGVSWETTRSLVSGMWQSFCADWSAAWNGDCQAFGRAFGGVLITVGTAAAPFAKGVRSAPTTVAAATKPLNSLSFSAKSLQHTVSRGHAKDFGVLGNWNKQMAQKVELAIRTHCAAPQTLMMRGYYRGQPALFFVNPNTRLAAIFDSRGSYITGFVLSEEQAQYLFTSGRKLNP
jgi:hypothetical protein